jgi:hypothetical protein
MMGIYARLIHAIHKLVVNILQLSAMIKMHAPLMAVNPQPVDVIIFKFPIAAYLILIVTIATYVPMTRVAISSVSMRHVIVQMRTYVRLIHALTEYAKIH